MDGKPKRRWLRFSIRTLLIAVTIFCVWLGWQLSIVRERKALRHLLDIRNCSVSIWDYADDFDNEGPPGVSRVREMLGDESVTLIVGHTDLTPEETANIRTAFPEAEPVMPDFSEGPLLPIPYGFW